MNRLLATLLLTLALPAAAQKRVTVEEYIEKYKDLAIADQREFGIPASVKMAQAILESDAGNSRLAVLGNNHFGIKCKSTWKGETIPHDDDKPGECFRKYATAQDSWDDHARFISQSDRYAPLFALDPMDYKGWARTLKECGYATNPRYPELLINMIETHNLFELDSQAPAERPVASREGVVEDTEYQEWQRRRDPEQITLLTGTDAVQAAVARSKNDSMVYANSNRVVSGRSVFHNNGSEFVVAQQGDTYESLASTAGIKAAAIRRHNDAPVGQPKPGDMVYLHPKASRAYNGHILHTVQAGETLHDVAQRYGIKLVALAHLNRIEPKQELRAGEQLKLM